MWYPLILAPMYLVLACSTPDQTRAGTTSEPFAFDPKSTSYPIAQPNPTRGKPYPHPMDRGSPRGTPPPSKARDSLGFTRVSRISFQILWYGRKRPKFARNLPIHSRSLPRQRDFMPHIIHRSPGVLPVRREIPDTGQTPDHPPPLPL